MKLTEWTVDYGSGPSAIQIPHAWHQDMPVEWEGPALYRAVVPPGSVGQWLLFQGVSYEARVLVDGVELGVHRGIWDAFAFKLPEGAAQLEVHVTKNGGPRFPVKEVASGFLPFVFHTFGGIYKDVEVVASEGDPTLRPETSVARVCAEGTKLIAPPLHVRPTAQDRAQAWLAARQSPPAEGAGSNETVPSGDGAFYARGVLTWGWYPELGHPNPPDDTIRSEIETAKSLGFNLVKFCLWVPSHRYLELLAEAGMWAWIELPLWDPTANADRQAEMADELERIARQYAHHPNIAFWTCGCELHESTSAAYRQGLYERVSRALDPKQALVKDNSGSAEMYGGDLREFGDFYDFHPYCDTHHFPEVLDSLLVGPRKPMPVLLGEFNDIDLHRDLPRLRAEAPYWASLDPALNAQGVRWQHDLPGFLPDNRFAKDPEEHRHTALMASSLNKSRFIRKVVQESVRARSDIAGYVVTGWRDTPISTAGAVDDWGEPRFKPEDMTPWNGPSCLFQIPTRRPPWVHGGNRPGWIDPFNWFVGRTFWKIGVHSEVPLEGELEWDILHFSWDGGTRPRGRQAQGRGEPIRVEPLRSTEVGQIAWEADTPGGYLLRVRFAGVENSWPFWVVPPLDLNLFAEWGEEDTHGLFEGFAFKPEPEIDYDAFDDEDLEDWSPDPTSIVSTRFGAETVTSTKSIVFATDEATLPMPFWRESAYEFSNAAFWEDLGFQDRWERFLPISTDRAIDMEMMRLIWPSHQWEVLLNRIDVRTYREHPILMRGTFGDQQCFVTTLRPFGGLGNCPVGLKRNPSGAEFVSKLLRML